MPEIFEIVEGRQSEQAVIRVIGVGGGGGNTVNQMVEAGIEGVEFICANTDRQHLERCKTDTILQIGGGITRGLGAGCDPAKGREAALEDKDRIRELVEGTDMLFITAGMGGGTGTGAAPVIAEVAREMDILTVAVVTKPFTFEGKKRAAAAIAGIEQLQKCADSLILIPNDKLQVVMGPKATMRDAFKAANDVLQNAVQGIADLITRPGYVNLDFADINNVMRSRGKAMMGMGMASGDNRAEEAVEMALSSPLLDDLELANASGLLVNITCDDSLEMGEITEIMERVNEIASDDVDTKFGTSLDMNLNGELRVTVVATGLGGVVPQMIKTPEREKAGVVVTLGPRVSPAGDAEIKNLDLPPIQRQRVASGGGDLGGMIPEDEILNIPAFLRNQAD